MTQNNKRIAKNTIIVYIQLFITMIVNLVISRLVLKVLGASDYGLYNVVGGFITLFTVISASMAATTIRFFNYELGKKDGDINRIFNQSFILHLAVALVLLLLLESVGVFYIQNYLNIDAGKESDALFVFQISSIVSCIGVVNVPYQSLLTVCEEFKTIAIVEIFIVILRLVFVCCLFFCKVEILRLYSIFMCTTTLISILIYYSYSYKRWPSIVKWCFIKDWRSYREQFNFSNWNLLGTIAVTGRAQGSAVIINYFFGTTVNASYAIANMVLQEVNVLISRFDVAVAPQITQNVGAGQINRALQLASYSCRFCMLIMEIMMVLLYVELDFFLELWLGENVPEGTLTFCRYMLLIAVVSSTSCGLLNYINALGNIKWFRIQISMWYALSLVFGCVFYYLEYPAYMMMIFFVLSDILNRISQFFLLHKYYGFDIVRFIQKTYVRPLVVFALFMLWYIVYCNLGFEGLKMKLLGIFLTSVFALLIAYIFGITTSEKRKLHTMMHKYLK